MDGWKMVLDPMRGGFSPGFNVHTTYDFRREQPGFEGRYKLADTYDGFNVAGLFYREISPQE